MYETLNISVLAELERCGIEYGWASAEEVRVLCPFHSDSTPSCHINVNKRCFCCQTAGCNESGSFIDYLAKRFNCSRAVMLAELSKRYDLDTDRVVDTNYIEACHQNIWAAGPLLNELYKRGVTDDDVREYRFGVDEGRITIPIDNEAGSYVNVRKYLPGAPSDQKMKNLKGRSRERLWPPEQLKYERIVLCGGEVKAVVAARQLNKHNIGAVTTTSGEKNLSLESIQRLAGKAVWVCSDVDAAGRESMRLRCQQLYPVAVETHIMELPLDTDKYPHGDINDFVAQEHGDLLAVFDASPPWVPESSNALRDTEFARVPLAEAINAKHAGQRVAVEAVVSAMDTAPYAVPREVRVKCDKSQKECTLCSVYPQQTDKFVIHPESSAILEFVSCTREKLRYATMGGLGIPSQCGVVEFETLDYYNVEDTRVAPQLAITSRSSDRIMQPAVCIGPKDGGSLELNESYELRGRMWPHPKTQQSTLLISSYKPTRDALSSYECTDLERLQYFQPDEWSVSGIQRRLDVLYDDLEANVTRIYKRRDLHVVVDLTYHSPLFITFDGREVKGWVESLIVGDSAQGKSETVGGLMRHYQLGEKLEMKNASVAGILGGLQQMGSRWFVCWGVIPTHDKRLVWLEEVKGASTDVISKLTDMRSSGIAEIPKIEKRRTHARVRLVAVSNPRTDGRQVSTYNYGVDVIVELIGGLEDIRRFDVCHVVAAGDVDAQDINVLMRDRPVAAHTHTSDLCRSLVLWGWTRGPEEVVFREEVTRRVLERSTELCGEFTDAVPIIDRGSTRYKIARLAAALAVRTFSTEDMRQVIVREAHVDYVTEFLRRTYSSDAMGYRRYTEAQQSIVTLIDPEEIIKRIESLPFPRDFAKNMLHANFIDAQDLADWCGWDRQVSLDLMSFFVRKHALVRSGRTYYKTPSFIGLLKEVSVNGHLAERPSHIPVKEQY